MAKLDTKQVEEAASRIARDAIGGVGRLEDLVTKAAQAEGWNAEQIHRVARKTNVKVFEQKFAALSGAPDRIVDFDTVDSDAVIQRLHSSSVSGEKTAEYYPPLEDEVAALDNARAPQLPVREVSVKVAMEREVPALGLLDRIEHLTDVAKELRTKEAQLRYRWARDLQKLANETKHLGWDREAFEKNALALYGADVLFDLQELRDLHSAAPLPFDKTAADHLYDNTYGHEDGLALMLKSAMDVREDSERHNKALSLALETLAKLRTEASQ